MNTTHYFRVFKIKKISDLGCDPKSELKKRYRNTNTHIGAKNAF